MIKNIIFDWSGVINDNFNTFHQVVIRILGKHGVAPISQDELRREWRQPYMLFYNKYLPTIDIDQEIEDYREAYAYITRLQPAVAYPGIKASLEKFHQSGLKMIILSSDALETLLFEMKQFQLEGLFTDVNTNIHDKRLEIERIVKKNNFLPQETIFIGDTSHEVETGQLAKLKTGAVTWGFQNREVLEAARPDFIIDSLEKLEKIILGDNQSA